MYPKITYILVDLPETNVISSFFLSQSFPNALFGFGDDFSRLELSLEKNNKYDFLILSPSDIENIDNELIDMVINTRSMMEMNYSSLKFYFNQINRIMKVDGLLYLLNRYQKISFMKHYPFDKKWGIISSKKWPRFIDSNPCHELLLRRIKNVDDELDRHLKSFPPYGWVSMKHKLKKTLVMKNILKTWRGNIA